MRNRLILSAALSCYVDFHDSTDFSRLKHHIIEIVVYNFLNSIIFLQVIIDQRNYRITSNTVIEVMLTPGKLGAIHEIL